MVLRLSILFWLVSCVRESSRFTRATSSLYVRSDSDHTTVVAPQVQVAAALTQRVSVEADYQVDAWTGASVDVTTSASPAIREVRREVTGAVEYQGKSISATASYRYSDEPDYQSHGVVVGIKREFARKNTIVGLDVLGSDDDVGRAGDPGFSQTLRSIGARASLTQLIDARTLFDLSGESIRFDGFQSSPYRFVAIGGQGICADGAPYCVAEQAPELRIRNSIFTRMRRALGDRWSAGAEYRFYFDTWGVQSHSLQTDWSWRVLDSSVLSMRYRYYTQDEARFYRPRYFDSKMAYVTRDRKLSALFTHEIGVSYLHRFELDSGASFTTGIRSSVTRFDYLAFLGLDVVYALETTVLLGLEFP